MQRKSYKNQPTNTPGTYLPWVRLLLVGRVEGRALHVEVALVEDRPFGTRTTLPVFHMGAFQTGTSVGFSTTETGLPLAPITAIRER